MDKLIWFGYCLISGGGMGPKIGNFRILIFGQSLLIGTNIRDTLTKTFREKIPRLTYWFVVDQHQIASKLGLGWCVLAPLPNEGASYPPD